MCHSPWIHRLKMKKQRKGMILTESFSFILSYHGYWICSVEEEEEGVVSEADQSDPPVQEEAVPTKTKISLSGVSQEEVCQLAG